MGTIYFLLTLFLITVGKAQVPKWQWAISGSDYGPGTGNSVVTDNKGNVFVIGSFTGILSLDTAVLYPRGAAKDIFVAKFNSQGKVQWARRYGSISADEGTAIAVTSDGSICIAGTFVDATTIGSINLISKGGQDIFYAHLDSIGNVLWAKSTGGRNADLLGYTGGGGGMVVSRGYLYMAGGFNSAGSLDTMYFDSTPLISRAGEDIFLAKCRVSNGDLVWAKSAGGTSSESSMGMCVDNSSNVYITGSFSLAARFDTVLIVSVANGLEDAFIAKYDSVGGVAWVKRAGGRAYAYGTCVATDDSGNVYIGGGYVQDISFGNGVFFTTRDNGTFIAKYRASDGAIRWARSSGASYGPNTAYGITIDKAGNSIITGAFNSDNVFDSTTLNCSGTSDVFVVKYQPNGDVLWAKQADGLTSTIGVGLACDEAGNVYVTGKFSDPVSSFDGSTISNAGSTDMFLAKLSMTPTGIVPIPTVTNPFIFPNPIRDYITITQKEGQYNNYLINNTLGQIVATGILTNTAKQTIKLPTMSSGVYYLSCKGPGLSTNTQKFMVTN